MSKTKSPISSLLNSDFGLGLFGLAVAYMYRYAFGDNLKAKRACEDWLRKTAPTNDFTVDQKYDRSVGWRAGWRWYRDLPETRRDAACARLMREKFADILREGAENAEIAFPTAPPVALAMVAFAYARTVVPADAWAVLKGPV